MLSRSNSYQALELVVVVVLYAFLIASCVCFKLANLLQRSAWNLHSRSFERWNSGDERSRISRFKALSSLLPRATQIAIICGLRSAEDLKPGAHGGNLSFFSTCAVFYFSEWSALVRMPM